MSASGISREKSVSGPAGGGPDTQHHAQAEERRRPAASSPVMRSAGGAPADWRSAEPATGVQRAVGVRALEDEVEVGRRRRRAATSTTART